MSLRGAFSLFLLPLFLISLSGVAEAYERAEHNSYFHCKHTHRKMERTKACPCGCNKKSRAALRLTADHDSCESDDVVAHVPQFVKLTAHPVDSLQEKPQTITTAYPPQSVFLQTISLKPPVPPG